MYNNIQYQHMPLDKHNKRKAIINLILCIIAGIAFGSIVIMLGTQTRIYRIVGHSMNPTLYENNIVITKAQDKYERGDIIAFKKNKSTAIKRLIGLPGDVIDIDDDGNVTVNNEPLEEPYVVFHQMHASSIPFPIVVPEGKFFVLGDNRQNSRDSREKSFGYVDEIYVIGKVIKSIIPLKDIK